MNGIPGLTQPLARTWRSHQVHGRYRRHLVDRSCFDLPVTMTVEIWRFKCGNARCEVRTFCEPVEELAARMQRRTNRLTEALCRIGYSLGGAAAGRLAAHLGFGVSGDTVLRMPADRYSYRP
jgi:hypothetical protein